MRHQIVLPDELGGGLVVEVQPLPGHLAVNPGNPGLRFLRRCEPRFLRLTERWATPNFFMAVWKCRGFSTNSPSEVMQNHVVPTFTPIAEPVAGSGCASTSQTQETYHSPHSRRIVAVLSLPANGLLSRMLPIFEKYATSPETPNPDCGEQMESYQPAPLNLG